MDSNFSFPLPAIAHLKFSGVDFAKYSQTNCPVKLKKKKEKEF